MTKCNVNVIVISMLASLPATFLTVKHQASATQDTVRQQISYLLVRQTVENRGASGKPTERSNMPTDPGMAMARRFFILKVIVAPQFFLSCYFKVKLLILTLTLKYNYYIMPL